MVSALNEILRGFSDWRRWAWLGLYDIRLQHRRSFFGFWWGAIGNAIFVYGIGHLYSQVLGRSIEEFLPHIAIGYLVWQWIAMSVSSGCSVFVDGRKILQEAIIPLNTLVLRVVTRGFIHFLLNAFVVVSVFAYLGKLPEGQWWVVLVSIPILLVMMYGVVMSLGIICAGFRDIGFVVDAVMRMMFFFTPIIWMPDYTEGSGRSMIAEFNPFYYLIEAVRAPLIQGADLHLSVFVVCGAAIFINLFAFGLFVVVRRRLIYWL